VRRAILFGVLLWACSKKPSAIAELTKADGPAYREQGSAAWGPSQIGTRYFLGDAARTADGSATLEIGGKGGAQIVMQGHTVLRFGGGPGEGKTAIEAGAIDLAGTGSYALDVGDVTLSQNGKVRITSKGNGRSSVELTIGEARVAANGQTFELVIGKSVDVEPAARAAIDAGIGDARVAPPRIAAAAGPAPDAPAAAGEATTEAMTEATIEVTGTRAEVLAPGGTAWKSLAPGAGTLARGGTVRVGAGTTARLVAGGTTLELGGGARVRRGDDLAFLVELGEVRAVATAPATVALPGGAVLLDGSPGTAAEARIATSSRDTTIAMLRGGAKLTGGDGASLEMNRGETALVTRTGQVRPIEAIPSHFDFRVVAGESFTIHDPKPPTAVQLQFDGKCPDGGIIEVDRDARFRTAKLSSGRDFANVVIGGGVWAYRLRCTTNGAEGSAVASGRIAALRDDGRRPLPKNQGVDDIDADGRNYRISYQSTIPNLLVHVAHPGAMHRLHLAAAGKERTFDSSTSSILVPGTQLREGTYTYWVERDGVKQGKVSTLTIDFDQTAPQVYIEAPIDGRPWTGDIDVRGAVLPGWSAAVGAISIPVDQQRRFAATVEIPDGSALAIRLSHPQHGVHYYLRRPK
jgi:hypothetical protein